MISLILIFPIIACLILFLIKNRSLNNLMITLYAFIHIICSPLIHLYLYKSPPIIFVAKNNIKNLELSVSDDLP